MRLTSRSWQRCTVLEALRGGSNPLPSSASSGARVLRPVAPSSTFRVRYSSPSFSPRSNRALSPQVRTLSTVSTPVTSHTSQRVSLQTPTALQHNSILMLTTPSEHRPHGLKGSVPQDSPYFGHQSQELGPWVTHISVQHGDKVNGSQNAHLSGSITC